MARTVRCGLIQTRNVLGPDRELAAIKKAMTGEPTIEWLLENQDKIVHSYHQKGLDGKL